MGLFDFLEKVTKATVQVAVLPIDIVKDVATMGGAIIDEDEPYTWKRLKDIAQTIEKGIDEIDK